MRMTLLIEAMAALQDGKRGLQQLSLAASLRTSPPRGNAGEGPRRSEWRGMRVPYHRGFAAGVTLAVIPLASPPSPESTHSADSILHDVFGYSAFRGGQAEIVSPVVA